MRAIHNPQRSNAPSLGASAASVNPLDTARHLVDRAILPMTVIGLVAGLALTGAGRPEAADIAWTIPALLVAVRLAWAIVRDLVRGEFGVDLIAILAIVGALLLGEPFAAAVIGVMLATGEAMERYAQGRAHRGLGRPPPLVQPGVLPPCPSVLPQREQLGRLVMRSGRARQRSILRRHQGLCRQWMVRGKAFGHRRCLQDLRGKFSQPGTPAANPAGSPVRHRQGILGVS